MIVFNGGRGTFRSLYDAKGADQYAQPWTSDEKWAGRLTSAYSQYNGASKALEEAQKQKLTGPALQGFVNGKANAKNHLNAVKNEGGPWYTGKQAHFNVMRRLSGYKYLLAACLAAAG
jgi:hypothetical protein